MEPSSPRRAAPRSARSPEYVRSTSFSSGFSAKDRLLDQDPYWVNFPQL